jgi:hypothetical protein
MREGGKEGEGDPQRSDGVLMAPRKSGEKR